MTSRRSPIHPDGWLIWSLKWGRWHRRGESGGAAGYTDELASAGVFPESVASAYNDRENNEAVHVRDKAAEIQAELDRAISALASLQVLSVLVAKEQLSE